MITVTRRFKFDSAHFLPDYNGKCANVHGHTWKLDVTVAGEDGVVGTDGFVIDFATLKKIVQELIIDNIDHTLLNETVNNNPTAELMLESFVEVLREDFKGNGIILKKLRLYESDDTWAEWKD